MVRACVRAWMLMFVGGDCLGVRVRLCMPSKGEIVLPCMWLPVLWLTANHPPPRLLPFPTHSQCNPAAASTRDS